MNHAVSRSDLIGDGRYLPPLRKPGCPPLVQGGRHIRRDSFDVVRHLFQLLAQVVPSALAGFHVSGSRPCLTAPPQL